MSAIFQRNLRAIRQMSMFTLEDLAYRAEISVRQLSRIETGRANPSLTTMERLAAALSVPLAALFEDTPTAQQAHLDTGTLQQGYVLGQGFIADTAKLYLPPDKPILPAQKTIDDLVVVNQSLVELVNRDPQLVHALSPVQFEEMVCELFHQQGYRVTMTKATRDGGKDFIVIEDSILGGFLTYVECKKYRPDRPIGVNLVKELYGTITADRATAGVLVTSSYFTKGAVAFQQKLRHQISLMDYIQLTSLIQSSCQ